MPSGIFHIFVRPFCFVFFLCRLSLLLLLLFCCIKYFVFELFPVFFLFLFLVFACLFFRLFLRLFLYSFGFAVFFFLSFCTAPRSVFIAPPLLPPLMQGSMAAHPTTAMRGVRYASVMIYQYRTAYRTALYCLFFISLRYCSACLSLSCDPGPDFRR